MTRHEFETDEVVRALAADVPQPDPAFAASLGERVRQGFPREPRFRIPRLRRPPMFALAGAASILAAVAVVLSLQGGTAEQEMTTLSEQGAGGGGAEPAVAPDSALPGPGLPKSGFSPGAESRRIERSASLTLAVPDDRVEEAANDIVAAADRYDGFVLSSSVSSGEDAASAGNFELRIPAARLQPALGELSKLGDVRARTQSGQDITRSFVSTGDRLEAARAERRSLLARLETATADVQAESIRRRLDLVAAEINGLRGQLRGLRLRSDYATVSVTLQRAGGDSGAAGSGREGLGGALDDAADSLTASLELLVRVLGAALAPALLAGLLWAGARAVRRRRREAALG